MIMIKKRTAEELELVARLNDLVLKKQANTEELHALLDDLELKASTVLDLAVESRRPGNTKEFVAHVNEQVLKTRTALDDVIRIVSSRQTERYEEADGVSDDTVPELGLKLLPFLLPRKLRDAVAGDLVEDFQGYVAEFGRTYAVRWYWWELGRLCVSRLRFTAIVASIAFWLWRKIGF